MIANEDVRMPAFNSIAIPDFVGYKVQYAVNARPAFYKEMCYYDRTLSEDGWDKESGQEKDHKCRKNN